MAPLAAKCELDLAEMARRGGCMNLAAHHAAQALGIFRRLDMHAWETRALHEQEMLERRVA